jgi:hypothetical protein
MTVDDHSHTGLWFLIMLMWSFQMCGNPFNTKTDDLERRIQHLENTCRR